jgi:hypothetical protein
MDLFVFCLPTNKNHSHRSSYALHPMDHDHVTYKSRFDRSSFNAIMVVSVWRVLLFCVLLITFDKADPTQQQHHIINGVIVACCLFHFLCHHSLTLSHIEWLKRGHSHTQQSLRKCCYVDHSSNDMILIYFH